MTDFNDIPNDPRHALRIENPTPSPTRAAPKPTERQDADGAYITDVTGRPIGYRFDIERDRERPARNTSMDSQWIDASDTMEFDGQDIKRGHGTFVSEQQDRGFNHPFSEARQANGNLRQVGEAIQPDDMIRIGRIDGKVRDFINSGVITEDQIYEWNAGNREQMSPAAHEQHHINKAIERDKAKVQQAAESQFDSRTTEAITSLENQLAPGAVESIVAQVIAKDEVSEADLRYLTEGKPGVFEKAETVIDGIRTKLGIDLVKLGIPPAEVDAFGERVLKETSRADMSNATLSLLHGDPTPMNDLLTRAVRRLKR